MDYWAGAVKMCGGTSKMVSESDLVKIANYIYNTTGLPTSYKSNLTFDGTKAAKLGLPSRDFYLWSGQEFTSNNAGFRRFDSTGTGSGTSPRGNSKQLAICLGD